MSLYPQRYPQQNPQKRKYFVIIVHFGDAAVTKKALKSLEMGHKWPDKVILVDQGDAPLTVDTVLPIQIVRPQQNGGYGAGVNVGLGVLYGIHVKLEDIVIIMNNDVVVHEDAIPKLMLWWGESQKEVLAGAAVEESGSIITGGMLNLCTGRTKLVHAEPFIKIDYVHGAFLSAPYKLFLDTKGWPEKYFMYWEDVLLSKRARQAGYKLTCASQVRVTHTSNSASPRKQNIYYLVRNGASFMEKETPLFYKCYWWLFNRGRLIYHSFFKTHQDVYRGLHDAIRGLTGSGL